MNKETKKFKKVIKVRKIKKAYKKIWNILQNNTPKEFKVVLTPGEHLPKSKKYKKKKSIEKTTKEDKINV